MENIKISRSRTGLPCVGVGGGAATNTFSGRFILRDGKLAPAIFVRQNGNLSNAWDQAIVPIRLGDVVVDVYGSKPVDINNPTLTILASRITDFVYNDEASLEKMEYPLSIFPESVAEGLSQYHNRDGRYFVAP